MWLPCHPLRRLTCRLLMKRFDVSSAIYRNVDLRSPYRIFVGAHTNINKRCVLDDRGAVVASGVVVTKNVPPLAIVAGVPAKIIGL